MAATLLEVRTRARSAIEEVTARFWTDSELNVWINDALRDIARRAEVIQSFNTSVTVVAGTNKYNLPTNIVRVHRVEFDPSDSTSIYPLEASSHQQMDSVWGVNQSSGGSPRYYVLWGMPPSLQIQLYPVPSVGGVLNLFVYRLPTVASVDGTAVECPEGWEDTIVDYCEAQAKRKDHDPTWVEAMQIYEKKIQDLLVVTRQWHDQSNSIQTGSGRYVPNWLYSFGE